MKKNKQQVLTDEQKTDAYIRRKMMEAADAYEAQLNADHSLDDIHLTDDMRADMLRRIAEADAEASRHEDSKDTDGLCYVAEKPDPLPDCVQERARENGCGHSGAGEDMHAGEASVGNMFAERKSAKNVSAEDMHAGDATAGNTFAEGKAVKNVSAEEVIAGSATAEDAIVGDAIVKDAIIGEATVGDTPSEGESIGSATAGCASVGDAFVKNAIVEDTIAEGTTIRDTSAASTDVRLLLSEEDRRALEIGKRALRFRKHRRCLQAAGILLVVGLGIACASMSSEASRIWWADLWDSLVGREAVSYLESADKTDEFDPQIRKICAEIKEKTDINALYFMYMPKDMVFDNYMVERDLGTATMQYRYRDTYLTVHMIKKKQDSVMGQITDGNILETVSVSTSYGTVKIHMQENLDGQENYSVEFVQNECSYKIYGMIAKEEFIKIIENSFFI